MRTLRYSCHFTALLLALLATCIAAHAADGFLRTSGEDIVDERGQKVLLRGVGLGNWLLPEGYMWHFGNAGDRPRRIEKVVSDLIGPENAAQFWTEYRRQYITESDIQRIAALGFNCVRAPLNARLFLTQDGQVSDAKEGFDLLQNLVGWCRKAGIYVVIDMHAAPGGQTGANIDDSADDQPRLFMDPANQQHLVDLWVKLATRYQAEPVVAAYDLLNEPLPESTGAAAKYKQQLEPLYRRLTTAIRAVDKKHIITIEGADWANEWTVFSEPFDPNLVYQFHYYCWDRPTKLKGVDQYLQYRKKLRAPVWAGETGEKDNVIYWGTTDYFEANNIGWAFWPWKKMATSNTPYSIKTPAGWDAIAGYSRGEAKPAAEVAQKAFDGFLRNIRLENCVYFPDVVNAIFRRVPGRVEAENYGHEGLNHSYLVKNTALKAKNYRASETVPIDLIESSGRRNSGQAIRLGAEEWTAYTVNSEQANRYSVSARVKPQTLPASLEVFSNGKSQLVNVTNADWSEIKLQPVTFAAGPNLLKLAVRDGMVSIDWLDFRSEGNAD